MYYSLAAFLNIFARKRLSGSQRHERELCIHIWEARKLEHLLENELEILLRFSYQAMVQDHGQIRKVL
jgi:hypothetical protein